MEFIAVNPSTEEAIQSYPSLTDEQLDGRLSTADQAFRLYRHSSYAERAGYLRRAARLLETEQERWAFMIACEMGKPLQAARDEVAKCALVCRYYADHGEEFLRDKDVESGVAQSFVRCQPLGLVLAIMPWNFPFWQVFRFAAPALMAGNVALLKPAPRVPRCSLAIEEILLRAGFPVGAFQCLFLETERIERVINDPRVQAVTLTGSVEAGAAVAAAASRRIKKSVLELGGSDPFIILPTADLPAAVAAAVSSRTVCNGQSCIAAKRFMVAESIADAFESAFVEAMEALTVGDPLDEATQVGPLLSSELRAHLQRQVDETVRAGARVLTGGTIPAGRGFYYRPTVLTDIPDVSPASREEFFGPVALLWRVHDIDEAIRRANETPFGLGASAWTKDWGEQERLIDELESGMVFINDMVVSDPRLPFGGIKASGYGRELGEAGIREFVNIKTVRVK